MSRRHSDSSRRPALYGDQRRWAMIEADSLTLLPQLPDACVDVVITDPPYGIGFRGSAWDSGSLTDGEHFTRWARAWAWECRRLLKPGGYLVAFGAPRTVHRLMVGIEDAGLEIRDQLLWLYGSGMPKSRRLPRGLGTALKPAYEPIILARRTLAGTVTKNLSEYGTGALNVQAARIKADDGDRWPANVLLTHAPDCRPQRCVSSCAVAELDRATPAEPASRFFFCGKASRGEREAGCEKLPARAAEVMSRPVGRLRRNVHPTVKPLVLMRWLVCLVCPVGGVVLDPFTGSGSTGVAAVLEQRQFVGIEREPDYVAISCARLGHWAATESDQPCG